MEGIYEQLKKEIMDYLTPLKSLYKKQLFDFKMEQDIPISQRKIFK